MANLFKQLNKLKTNIFGGPGNTGFTKPPATLVQDIDLQESPTGKVNRDPLAFSTLAYPMDVQQNFQNGHYMLFYVNVQDKTKYTYTGRTRTKLGAYEKIKGESSKEARYNELRKIKNKKLSTNKAYSDKEALSNQERARSGQSNVKKGVQALFNKTTRISDSVAMYLPPNIEDNTTAGYNDMRTGIAGFIAARGIDLAQTPDAESLARQLIASGEQLIDKATKRLFSELSEVALGAEGTEQLINKAFGQAENPYMEVLFDAMSLRTFTYNFTFAPKNEQEALEVQKIIQLFRFHMAPELRGGQSRFLGLPSQFDIHYMFLSKDGIASENNYYNRIATCVLQNCVVNYTPNGVKSFEDGGPTTTTMTLTFKETELLTKDLISQGY